MTNFAIVRLGKDSVADIRKLDSLHASPADPVVLTIRCSQVPQELVAGDYVFLCLGSDNNKGIATEWERGVRAFGTVTGKTGGPGYGDQWDVAVEAKVVLPQSVTQKDLLARAPTSYYWCSDMPVLGVAVYSNQTVQLIKADEPNQNVSALAYSLNAIFPSFRAEMSTAYPELSALFDYVPASPVGVPAIPSEARSSAQGAGLVDLARTFQTDAAAVGLRIELNDAYRLVASLLSKRFLIATGLAGSGKTKLAQAFSRWISSGLGGAERHALVPVGADWVGNENILGYPDGLDRTRYVTRPALDLILRALGDADTPYFLILDEMNLSHVERYFADILSTMESDEKIQLYGDGARKAGASDVPSAIDLPRNLFVIGTVNVDETTYMFSPKVLDRANVIEFRMDSAEMASFLANPLKPDLAKLDGRGTSFGKIFVETARGAAAVPSGVKAAHEAEMLVFFDALQAHGAEFGYRVAHEAARFVSFYKLLGGYSDDDAAWFAGAFDCVVAQKLLPKLHGSRMRLGPLLRTLWFLSVTPASARGSSAGKAGQDAAPSTESGTVPSTTVPAGAPYPMSAEKIGRMWRLLNENGFASFAEA